MKIERFKSILLIILVISSIVLTANKWLDEKLWPEGYSFFSDVKNKISLKDSYADSFNPNKAVLKPAKIIVNNLSNHTLYTKSQDKYSAICDEITDIFSLAFSSDEISISDKDEWNDQLQTKSCYLIYPVKYDASYFTSQLSLGYKGKISCFKEFVIAMDPRIETTTYLYIKDALGDDIEKIRVNSESENIKLLIDNAAGDSGDINYYSFELNFNSEKENGINDHVVINDNVLVNISAKYVNRLIEENLFYDVTQKEELYTGILSSFGYNTSGIRKYIESDNSMVFVENYGTLKLHSNGLLEYKALDAAKGISLNASSVNSCINSCLSFVNSVTSLLDGETMYYEIASDIHDISSKSFSLSFDYYINDNKIIIPAERYGVKNAVNIEVSEGKIVSYTQIFTRYTNSAEQISCGSAIDAIDLLEDESENRTKLIDDIFAAYSYDSRRGRWLVRWHIRDDEGNVSTIVSENGGASNELETY